MYFDNKPLKLKLHRNLTKSIKRGHPWLYKDAILNPPHSPTSQLSRIYDKDNKFLAWAYYNSESAIAVRVLSLNEKWNPEIVQQRILNAISYRKQIISQDTTCYRLIHGEGDFLPGIICDIYNKLAVLQLDGEAPSQFWDMQAIAQFLKDNLDIDAVYYKARNQHAIESKFLIGTYENPIICLEHGLKFEIDFINGQKTGFFIDQRENRKYIQSLSENKEVVNLFSYTGGFSIYAGKGFAKKVTSVDISHPATENAQKNWELNQLTAKHEAIAMNVFDYLDQLENEKHKKDMIIVDPPSFSNSKQGMEAAKKAYIDIFTKAARSVKDGGDLVLSSCSSHLDFKGFMEIAEESLSKARCVGQCFLQAGQSADHPFPLVLNELQYLKFAHFKIYR